MVKMVIFLILLVGINSCSQTTRNNNFVPPNIHQVNRLFYFDEKDNEYLYDYLVKEDEFKMRKLSFDSNLVDSCFLHLSSFIDYGTFGIDKNNIYFIEGGSGERYIRAEKKQKYKGVIFFENSRIRIVNDTLRNYGVGCIEDSLVYDMSSSINGQKINLGKLRVIKTYPDYEGYCDFLIYEDKFYRHCCYIKDISADTAHLNYYYKYKKCAKAIKI